MIEVFDSLRDNLLAAGWRVENNSIRDHGNLVNWYAWIPKRPDDWPDCECNDKAPALSLHPSYFVFSNGHAFSSVEFRLCGQMGGRWYDLKMYSVSPDEALAAADEALQVLGTAWKAVAAATAPSL